MDDMLHDPFETDEQNTEPEIPAPAAPEFPAADRSPADEQAEIDSILNYAEPRLPAPVPADAPANAPEQAEADSDDARGRGWLRAVAGFFALLVIAFAVFCILWDIRKGTSGGGFSPGGGSVQVNFVRSERAQSDPRLTDADGKYTFEGIAQTVMPSIVQIYTYSDGKRVGSGSGIILSDDGYIATNAHVVADADVFAVRFFNEENDESTVNAELVGHDTKTDLAVIRVHRSGLTPATLGDSDKVHLGETVCALGNPAGLSGSITTGIISGMNRKVRSSSNNYEMDCFQTDAAISPGNSGGALVNMYGEVIGITSSKYASSAFYGGSAYEGLGFAITVNAALPILIELTRQGYVSGRVRVGISFLENSNAIAKLQEEAEEAGTEFELPKELDGQGVRIERIDEDSDLNNTQLKPGDWILTMNGRDVSDYDSLNEALNGLVGGDSVHCRCGRIQEDGSLMTFEIDFVLLEDQSGEY